MVIMDLDYVIVYVQQLFTTCTNKLILRPTYENNDEHILSSWTILVNMYINV